MSRLLAHRYWLTLIVAVLCNLAQPVAATWQWADSKDVLGSICSASGARYSDPSAPTDHSHAHCDHGCCMGGGAALPARFMAAETVHGVSSASPVTTVLTASRPEPAWTLLPTRAPPRA